MIGTIGKQLSWPTIKEAIPGAWYLLMAVCKATDLSVKPAHSGHYVVDTDQQYNFLIYDDMLNQYRVDAQVTKSFHSFNAANNAAIFH